jgi:hypothetical protein
MSITGRIAEVEAELTSKRTLITEMLASCRGLEAELAALQAGLAQGDDLVGAARTEAIVTVLHKADGSLSPPELVERLHAAGRDDIFRSVTATLDHLIKRGRVVKVGRGRYTAG